MNIYDQIAKFGWYSLLSGNNKLGNGHTYFVDGNSGNAANNSNSGQGASWDAPFLTINYAISRCSNNADDVILVAQDHTETIADTNDNNVSGTTTDEFCVDKTGITIIGLGTNDRRPKITLATATDACIDIRAPQCTLYNLWFYNNIAANVAMLDAQAAADGLTIENCRFDMASSATDPILMINLTANCDDVTIRGCKFYAAASNDATLAAVKLEGGTDRLRLIDNVFVGDWNEQVIDADTAASTEVEVIGNLFYNVDAGVSNAIDFHANTTGFVANNVVYCPANGTGGGPIVADKCVKSNNKITYSLTEIADEVGDTSSGLQNNFYVDSGTGADTNDGKSWGTAMATVDAAIGKCSSNNGDIIHVAAGHAEDITGATIYLFDLDVAGVTIIGYGNGDLRPTFTMKTDATNAVCYITGADTKLVNLRFLCGVASANHLIDVAADDVTIENCEFGESGQTALSCITADSADNAADNLVIKGCRFYTPTAGNQDNAIEIGKDMAGVRIIDNYIMGNFDEAAIEIPVAGNACQDLVIKNNIVINEQTGIHCIEVEQTALTVTGICANNILVNDTRGAALRPNILNCYGNIWMALGGNVRPVILEGDATTPGQNIYVNSSHAEAVDDTAHGTSWDFPCATIDYAVALCTADNNDIIHVGPGHEETLDDSTFIDLDVAGITVKGYGNGDDKPLITYDHADGEVIIGAKNVTIDNLRFRPSVDDVTNAIIFDDGMNDCTIKNCEFGFPETATDEFAIAILTGDATNRITIDNCKFMAGAQAAVVAIDLVKDTDHTVIKNCWFTGAYSVCQIRGQTTASTNLDIHHNVFHCTGATDTFNLVAASTGIVRDNYISVNAATFAAAMDIGNCLNVNNFMIADDDLGGAKCDNRYTAAASVTETADG